MRAFVFLAICHALSAAEILTGRLPPSANVKIYFDRDIRPIFEASCLRCHGPQKPHSDFRLDSREPALNGGDDNTNDIVPGDSEKSFLINYAARQTPEMEMPPVGKGDPLTPQQIGALRAWIDQGADWGTNSKSSAFAFAFEPALRQIYVHGDESKFRELEGFHGGMTQGVEKFSAAQTAGTDGKISLEGHFIVPNQDVKLILALDKTDLGFVHAGFDDWRKYYDNSGGYDTNVIPSQFALNSDLYVDSRDIWVDFGLTLPRRPQIMIGFEYQSRIGNESMLDWGNANGKNIYPATQSVDERTRIVKLDVTHDIGGLHLEDSANLEFYSEKNGGAESSILFGGTSPDTFINTQDDYHHVQGMNTFTLEKQIRDGWLLSGGFYYSRLDGSDFFNQTTAIPSLNFANVLGSQQITLHRESEIFSLASLFTPLDYLSLSLGTQNEWTRENGFGDSVPDLELGMNTNADSNLDEFKASQNASLRFTKIPFTVLFAETRLEEQSLGEFQEHDSDDPSTFMRQTDARNFTCDALGGISTSPWQWLDWDAQIRRKSSDTDYNHLTDVFNGIPADMTNGYPAFILNRKIKTDEFETKLALRPANWIKTTLTYQVSATDYSSKTDPAFDFGLSQEVSPGGEILDGLYHAQTCGLSATLTPFRQLYFSGAFTYNRSSVVTADNGDPSIAPYRGNICTLTTTAAYELNAKTRLQAGYVFSCADYAQNNSAAGVPLGLDFTRHELLAGLVRQITKNLSGALRYEYSQYTEPSSGDARDFTAHEIFATLAYKWP
ncbi:MAG TPA: c-type cytochrome domain-containing protein [Verrucomicrobiae bacterium]